MVHIPRVSVGSVSPNKANWTRIKKSFFNFRSCGRSGAINVLPRLEIARVVLLKVIESLLGRLEPRIRRRRVDREIANMFVSHQCVPSFRLKLLNQRAPRTPERSQVFNPPRSSGSGFDSRRNQSGFPPLYSYQVVFTRQLVFM
jgi:hypothetical protein